MRDTSPRLSVKGRQERGSLPSRVSRGARGNAAGRGYVSGRRCAAALLVVAEHHGVPGTLHGQRCSISTTASIAAAHRRRPRWPATFTKVGRYQKIGLAGGRRPRHSTRTREMGSLRTDGPIREPGVINRASVRGARYEDMKRSPRTQCSRSSLSRERRAYEGRSMKRFVGSATFFANRGTAAVRAALIRWRLIQV